MQNYLAYMYCNLTLNLIEWLRVRPIQRESVKGIYMENFAVYRNVLAGARKAFLCRKALFHRKPVTQREKSYYGNRKYYLIRSQTPVTQVGK